MLMTGIHFALTGRMKTESKKQEITKLNNEQQIKNLCLNHDISASVSSDNCKEEREFFVNYNQRLQVDTI